MVKATTYFDDFLARSMIALAVSSLGGIRPLDVIRHFVYDTNLIGARNL